MNEIKFRVRQKKELFYFPHLPDWDFEDYDHFSNLVHHGGIVEEFTNFVTEGEKQEVYENDKIKVGFHYDGDRSHKEYIGTVRRSEGDGWWVDCETDSGDSLFDVIYNHGGEVVN